MTTWRTTTAAALLLAGCSAGSPARTAQTSEPAPTVATPTATAPATPAAAVSPRASAAPSPSVAAGLCTPAFPGGTGLSTTAPVGGPLGLASAAVGAQVGYDRVVFRLGGAGKPGWRVEYVAAPTADGSGNPVAVTGSRFLRVLITDVGYPGDTGVADPAVKVLSPSGTAVVRQVVLNNVFEGQYTAFIGLSATRPFRVLRLSGPPRLVVDVRGC